MKSKNTFKRITSILVGVAVISAGLIVISSMGKAQASPVTVLVNATITADNDYALYYGTEDGSSITFVGRSNLSDDWKSAENWSFDVKKGDYIYVAAWSDNKVAQGLLGQFVINSPSLPTILTNTDWQVYLTFDDKGNGSVAPSTSEMSNKIAGASWSPVSDFIDYGSGSWGTIVTGINSAAKWIWGSPLLPGSGFGEYQIFRIRNDGKVDICHIPPGNPSNAQTITVSAADMNTHLNHGDTLGACPLGEADHGGRR